MSEIGSYYVTIIPSMKGAAKQIEKDLQGVNTSSVGKQMGGDLSKSMASATNMQAVGKQIQDVGNDISSLGGSLTKGITVPVAGATAAAAGLVATLGWNRLVSVDSAQAQLRGLGYTTEDVERISQNLVGALEGGMLTMGEATSAAAAGMAAGVEEGEELTRYIELLDAATAGSNGTFDEMNQIFARVQGSGTLMTNELQMIEQRMPGFTSAVADGMGVTREELESMVTAGEVSSADFLDVMEDFAGDMATEYAKSWEGMLQNTWAYVGILGEALLGGVFEQSKESIAEFIEFLSSDEVAAWAAETGEAIGAFFSDVVEAVKSAIDWWINLDSETQNLILTIAGIAVAAGPVLIIFGKLVSVVGGIITAVGTVVGWITQFAGALGITSGSAGGLLSILRMFTGPIGLIVTGLISVWTQSEAFREAVANLAMVIWDVLVVAFEALTPIFEMVWELIGTLVDSFMDLAGSIGDMLAPVLELVGELLTAVIEGAIVPLIEWISSGLIPIFELLASVVGIVFEGISTIISGAMEIISGIINTIMGVITGDWGRAWEGIQQVLSGAWTVIEGAVTTAINVVSTVIGTVLSAIASVWSSIWSSISSTASSVWSGITSFISGFMSSISGVISSMLGAISGVWSSIWSSVSSLASSIWSGITGAISGFMSSISGTISSILGSISGTWSSIWSSVSSFLSDTWNTIVTSVTGAMGDLLSGITSGIGDVLSTVASLPGEVLSALGDLGSLLLDSGKALIGGLVDGITGAFGRARDAVSNGLSGLRNLLPFSPAKEGPFSGKGYTLYSGQALIEDFGKGIAGASPGAIREMSKAAEEIAAETDISASIPDFLPAGWAAASVHSVRPAMAGSPATGSPRQDQRPAHFTINVSGVDPNEVAWKAADRINEHMRGQGVPVAPIPR